MLIFIGDEACRSERKGTGIQKPKSRGIIEQWVSKRQLNKTSDYVKEYYMNFYHAYYKRQIYDEDEERWRDTVYTLQGIIVIANDYDEAKAKIKKCLTIVETEEDYGKFRAVLVGDIVECIGLDRRHGFEGSFTVNPIVARGE